MTKYCYKCNATVPVSIGIFVEDYPVKGETIAIRANVTTCDKCGEKLWDNELDNQNLLEAFNQYRLKHGLLLPNEIIRIRERYDVDQTGFDRTLGFPLGTIKKLENGSLQTKEQNRTIWNFFYRTEPAHEQ